MRPIYILWGKVRLGEKRGRGLGFPTANIALHKIIPEGIYAAQVSLHGKTYQSAAFIGAAKTFDETMPKAEAYVLDWQGDLYGQWISLRLYKKLRDNKKFNSTQDLITQIKQDVLRTSEFFSQPG